METVNEQAYGRGLQMQLLGSFDVRIDGVPIPPLRSRKVQWLLALLVLRHDQPLDRDWLAGTLWPESAPSQALYNLRQSLSNLRNALGENSLRLHAPTVHALSLETGEAEIDVLAFDAAIAVGDADALKNAVAMYRGPLLEGCAEEWVLAERLIREESYLNALETLAERALAGGEGSAAIPYLRRVVQADPLRERAQRGLIQALADVGDHGAAVQTYRELRLLLHRELNTEPDAATTALFQRIRNDARTQPSAQPSPLPDTAAPAAPRRLPAPLTSLVGRAAEVEQVIASLRTTRLVTLVGPGGVGKTRLSIAVAEQLAGLYPEACFVDLAPLSDPALILQTVATALQVGDTSGRSPAATLQEHLRTRTLLLLLDNCEHLLDSCARLADSLLKNCPGVRILATSRQTLGLTGEIGWPVPPLSAPALTRLVGNRQPALKEWLSLLSEYEAVQLFVMRAQQARPAFQLSAHNAEAVARICARLDGLPLALELAAARVGSLSVVEIDSKLDDRFRLLTRGSRTALPRQQTLRSLMDWSYDLLNDAEKTLLHRLSVFAGGWSLQAAEQVCTHENQEAEEGFEAWEVLDLLTSLMDKSLVQAEPEAGQTRYRLLETIRQYALDRLAESGEVDRRRRSHRDYFLRLADEARERLSGPEQSAWLQRLEIENENLRAALDFCMIAPTEAQAGLELAGSLQQFWWTHGHVSEGRHYIEAALNRPGAQAATTPRTIALSGAGSLAWMHGDFAAARSWYEKSLALGQEMNERYGVAKVLGNLGSLATLQGDYAAARDFYEESLAIKRDLGDKGGIANTLIGLGHVAMEQGDYRAARLLGEESLALGRELKDQRNIARSLTNLGNIAHLQGDYAVASPFYEAGLAIQQELGDKRGVARSLNNLGNTAMAQGNIAAARALCEESLALQRELGDREGMADTLGNLGVLLGKQGDYPAAYVSLRECLTISQDLGTKWVMAYAFEGCAELARRQQQTERAIQLYGSAHALRAAMGSTLPAHSRQEIENHLAALREATGEELFAAAWTVGKGRPVEQTIAYATASTPRAPLNS